jgi:hypothetical protein
MFINCDDSDLKLRYKYLTIQRCCDNISITMTVLKGYFCAEECRRMLLEVGKKVKRVKRAMVDVISLVKNVSLDIP